MSTPKDTERVERELTRSLHDRVDHLAEAPLTLADVRGRARGITRRRRLATAAGVAAAVALVAPAVLMVVPGDDRADVEPAAPSPTTQVTPDDARAGGEGLDVTGLPMGDAPVVGYLDRTGEPTAVLPNGNRVVLDVDGEVHGFARLLDGRFAVVTSDDRGDGFVEVTDARGANGVAYERTGGVALGPDRDQLAWAAPDGEVQVLQVGQDPRPFGRLSGSSPTVASLSGGDCFAEVLPGGTGGCIVTADIQWGDGRTVGWVLSTTGADGLLHEGSGGDDPSILAVADHTTLGEPMTEEYGEMVAGITEVRVDGTCSGVYGPTPQRVTDWLVETCDHRFGSFSPSASRVLAWESYGDGIGHNQVGVYDVASGELLWDRVSSGPGMAFVHSAAWEDDERLLAPAHQDGAWHLVRFGPDGAMELAAEPVDGDDTQPAYVPEIQP